MKITKKKNIISVPSSIWITIQIIMLIITNIAKRLSVFIFYNNDFLYSTYSHSWKKVKFMTDFVTDL